MTNDRTAATGTAATGTALVVIDVQESFRQRPIWAAVSNPDIVDQVDRLVDAARAARRPGGLGPARRAGHRRRLRPGRSATSA